MNIGEVQELLETSLRELRDAVEGNPGPDALEELRRRFLGKRSPATRVREAIKALEPDDRPRAGKALGDYRAEAERLIDAAAEAAAAHDTGATSVLDLTIGGHGARRGHLHLITQVRRELEDLFIGLGYTVAEGPEVETDWYNFQALNMPPDHPARSMFDTLYVRLGASEQVVLRTHTSPVQVRVMESTEPPIYSVMPGRTFRRDTLDARHSPVFHQIEGLVVDEGITFGDLAGTIETFTRALFGEGHTARLRPSFFPFTEPSAEFEVTCIFCEGDGCGVCSGTGWIELGGCGMVDPTVFEAVGYDPEVYTGFAFGFGLERMAQMRFGIDHVKTFFENDIRFLAQF